MPASQNLEVCPIRLRFRSLASARSDASDDARRTSTPC
ncbi:hypothetical protein DB30_03430 [Enhygromyxa salina]|uniref:Uncharacterized protein n=1 Tax=Enhygromyxa salina TaxID=215803 RepID=A0A0C2A1X3_9BACT|nr:hypothetical protein DB30_03430 [Enhygromyxa salina]